MIKNKGYVLLSVVIVVAVLGVVALSVSASDDAPIVEEETMPPFFGRFRNRWLDNLDDEQRASLQEMIKENLVEVKDQLEEWGVKISELDDEQREILKTMIEENWAEVKDQLEEWGVEIPMWQGPRGWLGSLTDEQKEELQTMRHEYQDSVKAKLEEWGIETPEVHGPSSGGMVHGPRRGGMGFRGRGFRGFGLFKP